MSTGWTECLSVLPSNKQTDFEAIQTMRTRLPFDLLGIDSDNGTEFTLAPDESAGVNEVRYRYCQYKTITFTHSRLYNKNDQAVVEHTCPGGRCQGKNWPVVRRLIGYDHLESQI